MTYQCRMCSYTGEYFPNGACPGCGSRNIRPVSRTGGRQPRARKPYMLALCAALWFYLIVLLWEKFS